VWQSLEKGEEEDQSKNDIIASQLRHQILQEERDEQSHKNAAQLVLALHTHTHTHTQMHIQIYICTCIINVYAYTYARP
jgi:hypothetical protein